MSHRTLLVFIAVGLILLQQSAINSSASPDHAEFVTLYAHAHPQGETGNLPVLNALDNWGAQQAARLQEGEAIFSLDPPLGNDVTIDGTTTIRLWAKSDFRLVGYLAVYLTATPPNGTAILTQVAFNDTVFLDTRPRDLNYLVAINNLTLSGGSTILLHVRLTSQDRVTNVSLLYDNQGTPTQITLPIVNPTSVSIRTVNGSGLPTRIFESDPATNNATLTARITIVDALGIYRLAKVAMNIANSSGNVFTLPDILPRTVSVNVYNGTYTASFTLPADAYKLSLEVNDRSGNSYSLSEKFYIAPYFVATIKVIDTTYRPIAGASLVVSNPTANYTAEVNETGLAAFRVPSSRILGTYQLTIIWKNLTVSQSALFVSNDTSLSVRVEAYDLTIRVKLLSFDLPGTRINLTADSKEVSSGSTNSTGFVTFTQIPPRHYEVKVTYLDTHYQKAIEVTNSTVITIQVPIPYQDLLPYVGVLFVALAATAVVLRRRRIYRWPFDYLNVLAKGAMPDSRTTTIVGNSGSGKTVLMESLVNQSLSTRRGCIYVTNMELPSNVRVTMKSMGMDTSQPENEGRLIFIDCYSSLSGAASKEKRSIGSITDLTSLGILITQSIEEVGGTTDVYLDALTPLFTTLKPDYVLTFLQSVGAKVKSYSGGMYTIVGTSIEKETLTRIEEVSDCVIETQLSEGRSGQRRKLRVKKLRGHQYSDAWTHFTITDQGIMFYTRKSPKT